MPFRPARTPLPPVTRSLGLWPIVLTILFAVTATPAVAQATHGTSKGGTILVAAAAEPVAAAVPRTRPPPSTPFAPGETEPAVLAIRMAVALGKADHTAPAAQTLAAFAAAKEMLAKENTPIVRPQLVLIVDRSAAVQRLWVVLAEPAPARWSLIGSVLVSTGKPGRKQHFKTPVGVFTNDGSILGYRAQGTKNQNGIRGIGTAGMRVWDFGWQTTEDWQHLGQATAVRLEMHATDPVYLEPRLGRADSEACIRIPSRFDAFLDHYGLIDADLIVQFGYDPGITSLLTSSFHPSPLAGDKLIVVDTSEPAAQPSDPNAAQTIEANFQDDLNAAATDDSAPVAPAGTAAATPPTVGSLISGVSAKPASP